MPQPVYIICSESDSLDKRTGLLSLFHIVEGYDVALLRLKPSEDITIKDVTITGAALSIVVNVVWMREDNDSPEQEYDFEVAVRSPGKLDFVALQSGKLRFTQLFHRVAVRARKDEPWTESGICWFEGRLRESGTKAWTFTQRFPVPITVRDLSSKQYG